MTIYFSLSQVEWTTYHLQNTVHRIPNTEFHREPQRKTNETMRQFGNDQ